MKVCCIIPSREADARSPSTESHPNRQNTGACNQLVPERFHISEFQQFSLDLTAVDLKGSMSLSLFLSLECASLTSIVHLIQQLCNDGV